MHTLEDRYPHRALRQTLEHRLNPRDLTQFPDTVHRTVEFGYDMDDYSEDRRQQILATSPDYLPAAADRLLEAVEWQRRKLNWQVLRTDAARLRPADIIARIKQLEAAHELMKTWNKETDE